MQHQESSIKNFELNSGVTKLSDRLINVTELREWLGLSDMRSVRAWCKKMKVPLIVLGRKTYTISNFLDMHIENDIKQFVTATYTNSDEVMYGLRNDNELKPIINKPPTKEKIKKQEISKASKRFLKTDVKGTGKI